MKAKYFLILNIIIMCLFASVKVMAKNAFITNGHIVYAIANQIYSINLNTKKIKKIYKLKKEFPITSINKLDANKLLFGIEDFGKGKIMIFDVKTKSARLLGDGFLPLYMPTYKKVLFFKFNGLNIADINNFHQTVRFIGKYTSDYNRIVPISNDEVVFLENDNHERNNKIWLYDLKNDQKRLLPIKNCTFPQLWRSKTSQLVCFDRGAGRYFLTSLDGKRVSEMLFRLYSMPVLYLPRKDQLIMSTATMRQGAEVSDLWLYDFNTAKKTLISKNNGFALGAGVYLSGKD